MLYIAWREQLLAPWVWQPPRSPSCHRYFGCARCLAESLRERACVRGVGVAPPGRQGRGVAVCASDSGEPGPGDDEGEAGRVQYPLRQDPGE